MGRIVGIENQGRNFEINGTFGRDASSKGMLYKWTGLIDGRLVFIKTGMKYRPGQYSDIQPITEVLVSQILDILKVEHVNYFYDELEKDGTKYPVCYSYDFAKECRYVTMRDFVSMKNESNDPKEIYTLLCNDLGIKRKLDEMIVVDFLINNVDRHLRNFGMLMGERGQLKFAPLFDHGHSLYGETLDEILSIDKPKDLELVDDCKPFEESHYKQIKLVDNVNFKVSLAEILSVVDRFKGMMSSHRIECIKHLLTVRFNILKEAGIFVE